MSTRGTEPTVQPASPAPEGDPTEAPDPSESEFAFHRRIDVIPFGRGRALRVTVAACYVGSVPGIRLQQHDRETGRQRTTVIPEELVTRFITAVAAAGRVVAEERRRLAREPRRVPPPSPAFHRPPSGNKRTAP
jgi:hypothetical protein